MLLITKRFALDYAKYYRIGNIAHCVIYVQKIKLHTINDICKNYNYYNKIAHTSLSVQK